jgi:mRNA-degrading endonuclease RelE of RelBE toxin-antitoxin system
MKFQIKALNFFKQQIENLDPKTKRILHEKIQWIRENPYRYKKIHSKLYSKIFRVRLKINSKETRLIYAVINPDIILICLLDRKKDYKDLEKYLSKIKKELGI